MSGYRTTEATAVGQWCPHIEKRKSIWVETCPLCLCYVVVSFVGYGLQEGINRDHEGPISMQTQTPGKKRYTQGKTIFS